MHYSTMKNKYAKIAFCLGMLLSLSTPAVMADSTSGQSTEGRDFWVTFLQADQDPNNTLVLSLSISSRTDCQVTISNPYTNYQQIVDVTAGSLQIVKIYEGNVLSSNARTAMQADGHVCYAVNSEIADTCALHVTATADISLFATNYKKATFDATNVLPTASLLDNYLVQTYTPSDHAGTNATQGSHFAIIATEDNTIVDYCPTEATEAYTNYLQQYNAWGEDVYTQFPEYARFKGYTIGDTLSSEPLKKGQVFYVWTGKQDGEKGDLSGTYVKARNGKKIAVFQGCPHTNIPYQKKQRDHIFSQAMPTQYWGNTFVVTASATRKRDIIRIMAQNDMTEVRINGVLKHTIDFSTDKKQYWEFEIGKEYGSLATPEVLDSSCLIETSCPCAVHLFMVSQQYDGDKNNNGDPAMLWINPIEQQIDQVTFATYQSSNGTTYHYTNIVTDKPELMTLDGTDIRADFHPVTGSTQYYFAQKSLGSTAATHTLKSNGSKFIAHVYGFTENESYGYSAGGATKPLSQTITINGQTFSPDTHNLLCGTDTIPFGCHLNYEFEKIVWNFGDGASVVSVGPDSVANEKHYYREAGVYEAYALIYRQSSNLCVGQSAMDSIPFTVNIGRFTFSVDHVDIPCKVEGQPFEGKVYYTNQSRVDMHGENATIGFNEAAKDAGFKDSELVIDEENSMFKITIPDEAATGVEYGIRIQIASDCGDTDTTLLFMLNFDKDVLTQRYGNVLGLRKESFEGKELSDFQWYNATDSTAVEGQVSSVLHLYDVENTSDAFYLCFYINKGKSDEVQTCACAKAFDPENKGQDQFDSDSTITISSCTAQAGEHIFVNAKGEAEAQWINVNGNIVSEESIPDGGRTLVVPSETGFYILRVTTEKNEGNFKSFKKERNFKFIVM